MSMGTFCDLSRSTWTIRANQEFDWDDTTLPFVYYKKYEDRPISREDLGEPIAFHWMVSSHFIKWVEQNRGASDRCGIVLVGMNWDRDMRWSWGNQINELLIKTGKDWRIRSAVKIRRFPDHTVAVFETLGLYDLVIGQV